MEIAALICEKEFELEGYVNKIRSLGRIIWALAEREDGHLVWEGPNIGSIIADCADAIANVLDALHDPISRVFNFGDVSFLSELKKEQEKIEAGFLGLHGNIEHAENFIQKIDQFLDGDVKQIKDMKAWFDAARNDCQRQLMGGTKKKAPATADDQARASAADQD